MKKFLIIVPAVIIGLIASIAIAANIQHWDNGYKETGSDYPLPVKLSGFAGGSTMPVQEPFIIVAPFRVVCAVTATQFPTLSCKKVTFTALAANTASIYVGGNNTVTVANGDEYTISSSESEYVANANIYWCISTAGGQELSGKCYN